MIKGWPSQEKEDRTKPQYACVVPTSVKRFAPERVDGYQRMTAGDSVDSISSGYILTAASHGARVGDVISFRSGSADGVEVYVLAVPSANVLHLSETVSGLAAGDTFDLLRPKKLRLSSDGDPNVTVVSVSNNDVSETIYHSYESTPVDTTTWQEIVAALAAAAVKLQIFDSSGELMELGIGAAAAETRKLLITPGGNGLIDVQIPAGTRLSVRAVSAAASVGFLAINVIEG